jgi:hypothetical protein
MGIAEKINPQSVAYFQTRKMSVSTPRFHHKFTIKNPRSSTCFFQNPQQKRTNRPKKIKCPAKLTRGIFMDSILQMACDFYWL